MRTLVTTAAVGLALASVVGVSAHASMPAAHTKTLRFVDKVNPTANTDVDLGKSGLSAGDEQVFLDSLFQGGKKVGTIAGVGQIVAASNKTINILIAGTVTIPGGKLTIQSSIHEVLAHGPGKVTHIAVTGGTGTYRGAGGECTSTAINGSDNSNIVCALVLP